MENSDQETSTGPQTANQRGAADVSPDTAGSSSGSLSAELWQPPLAEWPSSALWEWAGRSAGSCVLGMLTGRRLRSALSR